MDFLLKNKKSTQRTLILVAGYWMSALVKLFYNPCLCTLDSSCSTSCFLIDFQTSGRVSQGKKGHLPFHNAGTQTCTAHVDHL